MSEIGIYARVSTTGQDPQRQLDEFQKFAENTDAEPETHTYADIISGTATDRGEEYQRLRADIEDGDLDIVIVHELSRLSRLGAGEIHEFLEFCLSRQLPRGQVVRDARRLVIPKGFAFRTTPRYPP